MTTQLAALDHADRIVGLVLDSVTSPHTKRDYGRALRDFLAWYQQSGQTHLDKATVQRYAAGLHAGGASPASVNQRLSAIRKLAREAADNQAIPEPVASGIQKVKGIRQEGQRSGRWLDRNQAQRLLNAPGLTTVKGLRDRAILAVLLGCGLRRAEAANLSLAHVQQREGRWAIVDLVGKRNKIRTVPMPSWAKAAVDAWATSIGLAHGRIFRSVHKGDQVNGASLSDQAIDDVVKAYGAAIGVPELAAHDLRRTFAKLARKGGAALEQVQLNLGHESLDTTKRYLGEELDFTDAPCDRLGLRLEEQQLAWKL